MMKTKELAAQNVCTSILKAEIEKTFKESEGHPFFKCLGDTYMKLKLYSKAASSYKTALDLCHIPNKTGIYYDLGIAHYKNKQYEVALFNFDKALQQKSDDGVIHFYKGNALRKLNQFVQASEAYMVALIYMPYCDVLWHNRGLTYEKMGFINPAIVCYEKSIELEPSKATYQSLGKLYHFVVVNYEKALFYYEKALSLDPLSASVKEGINEVLYSLQESMVLINGVQNLEKEEKLEYVQRKAGKQELGQSCNEQNDKCKYLDQSTIDQTFFEPYSNEDTIIKTEEPDEALLSWIKFLKSEIS